MTEVIFLRSPKLIRTKFLELEVLHPFCRCLQEELVHHCSQTRLIKEGICCVAVTTVTYSALMFHNEKLEH